MNEWPVWTTPCARRDRQLMAVSAHRRGYATLPGAAVVSYVPVARSTRTDAAIGSGLTSRPTRVSRTCPRLASSCKERDTFGCARPVSATSSPTVPGRSRSNIPSNQIERNSLLLAGVFDRDEEVADQLIGSLRSYGTISRGLRN